jgi:DMSO/TMAO reductase YedYZ molybdopterin-dependent catalytic subunit
MIGLWLNHMSMTKVMMIFLLPAILLAAVMASGCTSAGSSTAPTATPGLTTSWTGQTISNDTVVLTINGSVDNPMELTIPGLEGYPTVEVNMSATRMGRGENMTGDAGQTWTGQGGMTFTAGTDSNWQPGTGAGHAMPSGAPDYYFNGQSGAMADGAGGNIPSGPGGSMSFNAMNVTGISLSALLDAAIPSAGATNVTFVGTGGRIEVVPLSEIYASQGAAIAITGMGMLTFVPDRPDRNSLSGLSAIIVS